MKAYRPVIAYCKYKRLLVLLLTFFGNHDVVGHKPDMCISLVFMPPRDVLPR